MNEEGLYAAGYSFYQQNDYVAAVETFTKLVLLNAYDARFWRGLAASEQMLGKYQEALRAWAIAALLCDKDPYSHFHAAECLFSLNDKIEAKKALTCAQKRLNPEAMDLRAKIELLMAS